MQRLGGTLQTEGKPVQKWSIGSGSASGMFEENQGGLYGCRGVKQREQEDGRRNRDQIHARP